jgi:metallo-beta-lactamase class B
MAEKICESLWQVGGSGMTDGSDCQVYALDLGALVLVDCGAGQSWPRIRREIQRVGLDPDAIHTLLLTHAHLDHIGAAARIRAETGCRVVAHELDAAPIETGDPERTAASMYGVALEPCVVDHRVTGAEQTLRFGEGELRLVHTPGHTPGSLVAVTELHGARVLFGQDIHGPFHPAFESDKSQWRRSMQRVLALEADVLCEGHYGIYRPAKAVRQFIEGQLAANR